MGKRKKTTPAPSPEEARAQYFNLSYERSRVVYKKHLIECAGETNTEEYGILCKRLDDLNDEISKLEAKK